MSSTATLASLARVKGRHSDHCWLAGSCIHSNDSGAECQGSMVGPSGSAFFTQSPIISYFATVVHSTLLPERGDVPFDSAEAPQVPPDTV